MLLRHSLTPYGYRVVDGVARRGVRVAVDALHVKVVLGAESTRLVRRDDDVRGDEEGTVLGRGHHVVRHVPHARVQSCGGRRETQRAT